MYKEGVESSDVLAMEGTGTKVEDQGLKRMFSRPDFLTRFVGLDALGRLCTILGTTNGTLRNDVLERTGLYWYI